MGKRDSNWERDGGSGIEKEGERMKNMGFSYRMVHDNAAEHTPDIRLRAHFSN